MSDKDDQTGQTIVRDGASRRQFLRTGTAAALAGVAATSASSGVLAADCDQNPRTAESKQATSGSDSDEGAAADAAGCGRKPSISQAPAASENPLRIKTVRG